LELLQKVWITLLSWPVSPYQKSILVFSCAAAGLAASRAAAAAAQRKRCIGQIHSVERAFRRPYRAAGQLDLGRGRKSQADVAQPESGT
jgi:hypothetical protein